MARVDQHNQLKPSFTMTDFRNSQNLIHPHADWPFQSSPPRARMCIILQDRETSLYFKSANEWTSDIEQANDFRQLILAIDFVRTARLPNLDVILHFENPKYDVRLYASD